MKKERRQEYQGNALAQMQGMEETQETGWNCTHELKKHPSFLVTSKRIIKEKKSWIHSTCIITDTASRTKIPDEINNGRNIPVQEAIAARPPPSAKEPTSPINTDALYRLCKRKPIQAPAIDAPKTERSDIHKVSQYFGLNYFTSHKDPEPSHNWLIFRP